PGVGFLEPVERVDRPAQLPGRSREEAVLAQLVEQSAPFLTELDCYGVIAGQELEVDGIVAHGDREPDSAAAIGELRARLGEDRTPLVEAAEHRQGGCP